MMMPASGALRWLQDPHRFASLLLCLSILHFLPRSELKPACFALGLVSAPVSTPQITSCAAQRYRSRRSPLFSSSETATLDSPSSALVTDNSSLAGVKNTLPLPNGVWMPPSQNMAKRRGKVFSIQQPEDLLDFVIEDERLSVVKVYASWCKTCQKFDIRYRKLAAQYGDKFDDKAGGAIKQMGRARFAEMQYDNPNNEEICQLLDATSFPYILMYKGSKGKIRGFQCSPAKFQMLVDAVNELADPVEEDIRTLQQHLEELGLTDRR